MNDEMLSRVQATLLGVAIGDAMGMPWEMMTPDEILAATNGVGVTGFSDPVQRRIKGTMNLRAGDTTDDWQLTAANARVFALRGEYDCAAIAREHIYEFRRCSFGWGKTTKRGLADIEEFFASHGERGRNPVIPAPETKPGEGCGNGVAMRIAPFALFHSVRQGSFFAEPLITEVMEHGLMTHPDPRASFAAYAVAAAVSSVLLGYERSGIGVGGHGDAMALLDRLITLVEIAEKRYQFFRPSDDKVSSRLGQLTDPALIYDPDALRKRVGTACFSLESVTFAIATFLRHPTDFRAGVLEAVNAGGDTDSTASIVGALIGANCGLDAIPREWQEFRSEYENARQLGRALYNASMFIHTPATPRMD